MRKPHGRGKVLDAPAVIHPVWRKGGEKKEGVTRKGRFPTYRFQPGQLEKNFHQTNIRDIYESNYEVERYTGGTGGTYSN